MYKKKGGLSMNGKHDCSHKTTKIIEKQETYDVKGEKITVDAKIRKCENCNKEIFDMTLDTENLKKAYRIYKNKHNLMQSENIIALRQKYHLTQNMLSRLVGCTQATIARYERGSLQSETHNTALVLLKNPENIKKLFEEKFDEFNQNERKTFEQIFSGNNNISAKSMDLLENVYSYSANVYSGFKKFDSDKLIATISFFAKTNRCYIKQS